MVTTYNLQDLREKIACPQLGDDHYGEWGALPLEVRKAINYLIGAVVIRDNMIEANRKKADEAKKVIDGYLGGPAEKVEF